MATHETTMAAPTKPKSARKPMSPRKWKAVLMNLAKARRTPRTPESYARSRRNATKHGLFVRHLEGSFAALGEDPRQFIRLGGLLLRVFVPRDATERRLIRRLADAIWRHLRVYRAFPRWAEKELSRRLLYIRDLSNLEHAEARDAGPGTLAQDTWQEAYQTIWALTDERRFFRRSRTTLNEVERTLRLLLIYRGGNRVSKFHFLGRRYKNEIDDLSDDPRDWPRRYAAAVPVSRD